MSGTKGNYNVVEVILSGAPSLSLKNSTFKENEIIDFRVSLSVGDLTNIDNYIVELPKNIYHEKIICNLNNEISKLITFADNNYKIRIWSSHIAPDSYLLLLFVCSCLKNKIDNITVLYSDEYKKECYSPGTMTSGEFEKLSTIEHILSKKEICELSDIWNMVKKENSNLRIVQNGIVKSVNYDYFDNEIIDLIVKLKSIRIIDLTYELSKKYYISDSIFVFLISRLIDLGRIEVVESNEVFIKSVVKGVDPNE